MHYTYILRFFNLAAAGTHRLADVTSDGAGIRFGALAAARESFLMAHAAVRADIFEALDVAGHFALEVALEFEAFHDAADFIFLLRRKVVRFFHRVYFCFNADFSRAGNANAVQRRKRVRKVFIRNSDA